MAFDPISIALELGSKLIDRVFPDPAAAAAANLELIKMQQTGELAQLAADTDLAKGQLAVNQAEATNGNLFVSGWRPGIGWCCVAAFAFKFIIGPTVILIASYYNHHIVLPTFDYAEMSTILLGMLGLGGMRTVEKIKGVA